jgi:nucleotide-binding universal stress UspA family protein
MIRRILIPLDGSDAAEAALGHAVLLGKAFGAELHLLRVLSRSGSAALGIRWIPWRGAGPGPGEHLSLPGGEGSEGRGPRGDHRGPGGVSGEVIVETLRRKRHHLVVLTTHGSGKRSCMRVGGTALSVILNSGTSVMLVPSPGSACPGPPRDTAEILAPVDGSPGGTGPWGWRPPPPGDGARLQMVHVLAPPELLSRLPDSADARAHRSGAGGEPAGGGAAT